VVFEIKNALKNSVYKIPIGWSVITGMTGRLIPVWVDGYYRNCWMAFTGFTGRLIPVWVDGIYRNTQDISGS